jgi:hypothetical protein
MKLDSGLSKRLNQAFVLAAEPDLEFDDHIKAQPVH